MDAHESGSAPGEPVCDAEKADFVLGEVERLLDATLADREAVRKRAAWLLGVTGAAAAWCVGLATGATEVAAPWTKVLVVEAGLLVLAGGWTLLACLLPSRYAPRGGSPRHMMEPDYFAQPLAAMKMGYASNLQEPIDYNRRANARLNRHFALAAWFAASSPMAAWIIVIHLLPLMADLADRAA